MICYLVDFNGDLLRVDSTDFFFYIKMYKSLSVPFKTKEKYIDSLGGIFTCYYYKTNDSINYFGFAGGVVK